MVLRIKKLLQENMLYKVLKLSNNMKIGYVEIVKNRITKKNDFMANVVITDIYGREEYMLFPKEMSRLGNLFKQEDICIFKYTKLDDNKYAIKDIQNIKNLENLKLKLKIELLMHKCYLHLF